MDRQVTPPTLGPPPPYKQALRCHYGDGKENAKKAGKTAFLRA